MTATATPSNRHMVDQLADVRAQIKALQEQETDLKAQVSTAMGKGDSLGGDEFIAWQTLYTRKGGLDEASLKKAGIDPAAYRKPDVTVYSLRVERRVMEEAA